MMGKEDGFNIFDMSDLPDVDDKVEASQDAHADKTVEASTKVAVLQKRLDMSEAKEILAVVHEGDEEGLAKAMSIVEASNDPVGTAIELRNWVKDKVKKSVVLAGATDDRISPTGEVADADYKKAVEASVELLEREYYKTAGAKIPIREVS